jgi:NOL1/NOP2/sun family putative RNA methylase
VSDKEFFINRYNKLGWKYRPVQLKQAIRINTMNTDENELVKRLHTRGVELEKIPFLSYGYWVTRSKVSAGATSEYLLGLYSVQEAAAEIPATAFKDLKDKSVLDACAAPGGKTVQLADMMRDTGTIVALDIDKRRLNALSNHLERCHEKNTIVYLRDARQVAHLGIQFDSVLLDVPCSGNFAADKQWFKNRTLKDIERNAALQKEILAEAVKVVKPEGEIVYSTCTLEPEENELNIDWAIRNLNLKTEKLDCYGEPAPTMIFGRKLDSSIENCRRIWPGLTQGFFICKLRRRAMPE